MKKQLKLNRETVRNLDRAGLMRVEGGIPTAGPVCTSVSIVLTSIIVSSIGTSVWTMTPKGDGPGKSDDQKPEQPKGDKVVPI